MLYFVQGAKELGLNEHHERELVNFLRFCRFQRSQQVRTIVACFQNAREAR
jgi:leucine zipper transcription factor-like protein 1